MLPLILTALVAFLDQWTKQLVRDGFYLGESRVVVEGFFHLTYVRNTGAAWGMFGGQNTWLTVFSLAMLVFMVIFRRSFLSDTWDHRIALGLLLGGILGNLFDRVRLGWVTDFADFFIGGWHWPAFDIADAAICIGVGLYMFSALWLERPPSRGAEQSKPDVEPIP